jgi:hypothetical protein
MNLNENDVILKNSIDSAQDRDYWKTLGECGIELLGSINHRVIYLNLQERDL